jgi:Spy/CpxP family protein refolding chaperone
VLALFVLGVIAGGLATHLFYAKQLPARGEPGPFFGEFLRRGLDLSREQERQIQEILFRTRHEAAELRQELRPRVHELMEEATREIEQVLTPEQREAFARMRQRQRRRTEQLLLGPPGGHAGRGPGPRPRRRPRADP